MDFNPFDPLFLADPYPMLAELRATNPVFFYEPLEAWILTRHADVVDAFRDSRFSADKGKWNFILRQEGAGSLGSRRRKCLVILA